jgi:hypothetical protein
VSTRPTRTRLGFNAHITVEGGRKLYTWSVLGKLGAIVLQAREVQAKHRPIFEGLGSVVLPDGTWVYPADLGRHTAQPVQDYDSKVTDGCSFLEGVPCYYDGSSLQAETVLVRFFTSGYDLEYLQKELTDYYRYWILREEDP